MDFLGGNVSQCDEANKRFGFTTCCNNPTPNSCVQGGWPEFAKYGFSATETSWGTALSWTQLKKQIFCKKKPFCFSWGWSGGGGHLMVAIGYITIGTTKYVVINDPWPPNVGSQRAITYDEFVSSAGHTHWIDHYDIKKN